MDIGDDESALIHSKFHKAKRGLLSSTSSSSLTQSQLPTSPTSTIPATNINPIAGASSVVATSSSFSEPQPLSSSSSSSPSTDATLSADTSTASVAPVPIQSHHDQVLIPQHSISSSELTIDQSDPITPPATTLVEPVRSDHYHSSPDRYQHQHPHLLHAKFDISPQHIPVPLLPPQYCGGTVLAPSPSSFGTNLVGTPTSPSSGGSYPSSSSSAALASCSSSSSSSSSGIVVGGILGGPPPLGIQSSLSMPGTTNYHGRAVEQVFRFDSTDRERYLCSAISEEDEEVFSPGPSPSSISTRSFDSPHIVLDSPRITISPLRIEDSPPTFPTTLTPSPIMDSQNRLFPRVHTGLAVLPPTTNIDQARCLFGVPSSPVSPLTPNTPLSPSPLSPHEHMFQQGILEELYRRRCHSDSDLPCLPDSPKLEPTDLSVRSGSRSTQRTKRWIPHPLVMPAIKSGSLESDQSTPQDSPLDLSMKGSRERFGSTPSCDSFGTSRSISSLVIPHQAHGGGPPSPGVAVISPTTRHSVALRYNLEVSPVVEENRSGADMGFVCPVCGQVFSLHDRLAKHMASRHKSKPHDPNKSYPCEVCHRSFARSDMLTRHVRLHTGVKPYTCKMCGQVFSRSDHLSTHQRTHTGEKPYKCPQCPYSACRRDMITRHLRTHTRNSSSSSSDLMSGNTSTPTSTSSEPIVDERIIKSEYSRPPSSSSSFTPESPTQMSPALNLGSLSVHSPPPSS